MKSVEQSKQPTHNVYTVDEAGNKDYWLKIGAAWEHKDNQGLTLFIYVLGFKTKLIIREIKDKQERA